MFTAKSILNMIQNMINASKNGAACSATGSYLMLESEDNESIALLIEYYADSINVSHKDKILKTFAVTEQQEKDKAYALVRSIALEIQAIKI